MIVIVKQFSYYLTSVFFPNRNPTNYDIDWCYIIMEFMMKIRHYIHQLTKYMKVNISILFMDYNRYVRYCQRDKKEESMSWDNKS